MNKNINEVINENDCCGCYTCQAICHCNAIKMLPNAEGFDMPVVDTNSCVKCGMCVKRCPVLSHERIHNNNPKIYAGWSNDRNIRFESTSGGIFSELAAHIIDHKGFVCGAVYDNDWKVKHIVTNDFEDIKLLRSSKYIQSRIENCFKTIKDKLVLGHDVMMVGAPCQIAGLYNYLGKKYSNLYTVDFICRGVNSPKAFRLYLDLLEKKYQSKVVYVKFKFKKYGWNRFSTKIKFESGKSYIKDKHTDKFMKGYLKYNCFMRNSCYNCQFKGFPRIADITLGDFWGIEKYLENIETYDGVSMIMVNSDTGAELINKIKGKIYIKEMEVENIIKGNPMLVENPIRTDIRDEFLSKLDTHDFQDLVNTYIAKNKAKDQIKGNLKNLYYNVTLSYKRRKQNE